MPDYREYTEYLEPEEPKVDVTAVQVDQPAQEKPEEEGTNYFSDILVRGIGGGVEQAARGTYSTVKAGADALGADLPEMGEAGIDAPESIAGQVVRDVTQFGLGFVGGMGLLRATGAAAKLAPYAKEILASGLGTGVVADPTAPRLANLIQKYPWLENPVTEYLQQDDADGVAESKFKATLEDMMLTPAAMALFKTVKAMKNALKGNDAEAGKLADELAQDLRGINAGEVLEVPEVRVTPENAAKESSGAYQEWFDGAVKRFEQEEKGQAILDILEEEGKSPGQVVDQFWKSTYPTLPVEAQKKFERYITRVTGFTPGSTVAVDKNGNKIVGNTWEDLYPSKDPNLSSSAGELEGTERGLIALMEAANRKEFVKPTTQAKLTSEVTPEAPAVEIKTPSGHTVFKLTADEEKAYDAHVNYLVSNDHLEDLFNFPAFRSFNEARSEAMPETKEMLDSLVMYVKPKLDKYMKGEVRTHREVEKYADFLQENPQALYARMQQTVKNVADLDATITAAKGLTYSLTREMRRLATKIHFGASTAQDKAALQLSQKRLTDVFGMTLAIRKGAARATSAGRIETGESDLAGKLAGTGDVDELVKLLALTKDEKEAMAILKPKSLMGKLIDAHNEIWINGILSGVKTHVVNVSSATINTLLSPANQVIGGVLTRNTNEIREGFALYRGLYRHIFDSLEMAGRAFQSERAILDPGKSTDETMEKAISGKNFQSLGRFADWIGVAARIPGRFLKAEDEFFKQMNYRAKVEAQAAREAAGLVQEKKLDPNKMVEFTDGTKTIKISEVEKFIRDKFKSAFTPENAGLNKSAIEHSREMTFTQDLNSITTHRDWGNVGARVQQFAASHPWLRGTILPFIKVPTNLMRAVGDYTLPIAALRKEGMDILSKANTDPHKAAMFYGKLTTGTMFWSGATMLALQGRITGSAYGDKAMRDRQMESGWQPYSFVFEGADGKKEYISYQRLDPFGTFFGLAADWAYIAQHVDEDSGHNWATMASLALAKNISSKSYLQGLVEWSSMLGGGYSEEEKIKRMVQMRVASYVPNYMNLYSGNDELKEIRSVTDAMMAKIPGLSSSVEAKRDYFGEKRVAPMGYPWNAIDPFPVSEEKDAVRKELARLSRGVSEAKFSMPDTKLGNVDLTEMKNAAGQSAYDRWTELIGQVEIGGKTFHQKLGDVLQSFRYQEGTDGTSAYHNGNRIIMIKNEQAKYREKALREMLKEFESEHSGGKVKDNLRDMIRQDKRNDRAVGHGRVDRIRDLMELSNQ